MSGMAIDTSVVLAWAFHDESNALADRAMAEAAIVGAVVPCLFWYELRNAIVIAERRGRLVDEQIEPTLNEVARLNVSHDFDHDETSVMSVARGHRLSIYDASYLELARRLGVPLATLDRRLADAAKAVHVPLFE